MKIHLDSKGFTIFEVLIVLLVLTIFLSLSIASFKPLKNTVEKRMTISQLEADLYFVQTFAISRQELVKVQFYPINNQYIMKTSNGKVILKRSWPISIKLLNGSFNSYNFLPNGNISRFGTLTFEMNSQIFELIFNIGRGRFRVQE